MCRIRPTGVGDNDSAAVAFWYNTADNIVSGDGAGTGEYMTAPLGLTMASHTLGSEMQTEDWLSISTAEARMSIMQVAQCSSSPDA